MWIAVGGNPESVVRAGTLGLPLAIAIIGGMPEQFAPLADLYRQAGRKAGHDESVLRIATHSHGSSPRRRSRRRRCTSSPTRAS